tara:strand:- start:394 stop:564 length:171 start_codon:yes stop_codon:yes gene_type:complete
MAIYKLNKRSNESEPTSVTLKQDDGISLCIPFAADNTEYQKYLKWLSEGNTPEEAD